MFRVDSTSEDLLAGFVILINAAVPWKEGGPRSFETEPNRRARQNPVISCGLQKRSGT